ncbi:MAG: molybdopterin-dependent oxidoreductase [Bacteroidetes bacterium]|nr:molybdopterin-dependent oxidoreductase [Bacteroidota bacterium]
MKIKRRDFIRSIGVAGTGMVVFNPVLNAFGKAKPKNAKLDIGTWVPSTCQGCTTWCPNQVLIQNGRAVKVRGNPNSMYQPGMLCPKGHLNIQQLYSPDRVKMPMKRQNSTKGKGVDPQFIPITWDDAMTEIATKMLELRTNSEKHKFILFRGRYTYSYPLFYDAIPKIFGSPNKASHSTLCAEVEKTGPYFLAGKWTYRDYDLANTKYLVFWGTDPFRANRQIPVLINKWKLIRQQAKVVTIDPLYSGAAAKSDMWLPVTPGEDGALASAIAHHILVKGIWYKPFVGDFNGTGVTQFVGNTQVSESAFTEIDTSGIIKWWNTELYDKTPSWAAAITGISQSTIEKIAEDMAAAAPKLCIWYGPTMWPRGTYTAMAIMALHGLLGAYDNTGGPNPGQSKPTTASTPSTTSYEDGTPITTKIDGGGTEFFPAINDSGVQKATVTNNIPNNMLTANPYDIKMILGTWCNWAFSGADAKRWREALGSTNPNGAPYFVHVTTHASEFSQFADIVLPASHEGLENYSFIPTGGNLWGEISIEQPVVTKLFDTRAAENEISFMLAEKLNSLGFPNLYNYFTNQFKDPDTSAAPTNYSEFAEYATKFYLQPVYSAAPFGTWAKFKATGVKSSGPYQFRKLWGGNFPTPTKKFEFYSETLKKNLLHHAADSAAKVMTVTLTGTSGTANVNIGGTDYLATFNTSLTQTATDFVNSWAATILSAHSVKVTSSAATIVLTATVNGVDFTANAPVNASGDLGGSIATTTAINSTPRWTPKTVSQTLQDANYSTNLGEKAFVPHYEPPKRNGDTVNYPFEFIDCKSRYNREGRSQNSPFYYQFKKLDPGDANWEDCVKINPADAATLGISNGDSVKITSPAGNITVKAKLWEGIRPGCVAKTYGQGHWAYGRFASDYATLSEKPGRGNNNEILVDDYDRLTGSTARNGGFTGVKIEKV